MLETAARLIHIGHSPDPDDAFMFYALAKARISMRGFRVEHVIEDIESLNQRALQSGAYRMVPSLEVTAVSCHAYAYLADRYLVLRSGASVGDGYGPILVGRDQASMVDVGLSNDFSSEELGEKIRGKKIAIPGKLTTAYLTLRLFEPDFEAVFIPFDQIFRAVSSGEADYGLIIHEGQLTYRQEGFYKLLDLGKWWMKKTGFPLPLGVDVIRRDLGEELIRNFSLLFRESIEFARAHKEEALEYALQFGRGISASIGERFVGMYVNDLTVDLGAKAEAGFQRLLDDGFASGIIPACPKIPYATKS